MQRGRATDLPPSAGPGISLDRAEHLLVHAAFRTDPILRKIFKTGPRINTVGGISVGGIIRVAARVTNVFHRCILSSRPLTRRSFNRVEQRPLSQNRSPDNASPPIARQKARCRAVQGRRYSRTQCTSSDPTSALGCFSFLTTTHGRHTLYHSTLTSSAGSKRNNDPLPWKKPCSAIK